MAEVTGIGVAAGDAGRITTEAMLLHTAQKYSEDYPKGVAILLNDDNEEYHVGYRVAGLSKSEILALLEVAKTMILQDMGYIPEE